MDDNVEETKRKAVMSNTIVGPAVLLCAGLLAFVFGSAGPTKYGLGLLLGRLLISVSLALPVFLLIRYLTPWGKRLNFAQKVNVGSLAVAIIFALQLALLVSVPPLVEKLNLSATTQSNGTPDSNSNGTRHSTGPSGPAAMDEEAAILDRVHPGWQQLVKSKEFNDWYHAQPLSVQALADSPYAKDAIRMLDLYKASR